MESEPPPPPPHTPPPPPTTPESPVPHKPPSPHLIPTTAADPSRIYVPTAADPAKFVDLVKLMMEKIAEIKTKEPPAASIRLDVRPASRADTTSVYVRLHAAHAPVPPDTEPRIDLLQMWHDALTAYAPEWETSWAPQSEGKDKRMWIKIDEVFDDNDVGRSKKADNKVILTVRKAVDAMGYQTVGGFARSAYAFLIMALPAHVDILASQRTISIPAVSNRSLNVYRARQIEVESAYEIAVAGFYLNQDSRAAEDCDGWFASFQ
ncbi:hypothetical protein B0H17DRAFT_1191496 [Mycena rosella]|uniref:Uncharacterized protein n=1 Tax=Mycena rosella TaxID=1033263 RepID=A0AAD7H0F1_MYCRO|nr:hypothetical protein B0H17DRAFT_1191496 [Mycena rosella]